MKNIIPVLLLTMAGQLLAQPAYQIAAEISSVDSILLKDNIDQIIEAQFTAEQITETQRLAIISVVEFVNEPFGSEIIYENISPEAAILMHDLVIDNRKRKQEVGYNIYTTLRESNCVEELPGKYSDFLIDDLIIFTDEQLACYKKLRSSKKSEEPVWEELLEFQPEAPARAVPSPTIESPSPGFPSLPSKIIDATAQFLVDRVKEEFMLAFFNQFLERMDNSAELKGLFPNTFILLNTQDIFKVPSMGKVWVSAFEEDLKSVHYNFDQLVQTNPTYQELKSQPGFQIFSILNFAFYQIGQKNSYSLKMLDEFRDRYGNRETIVGRHIELLHRVLSNLRGSDEEIVGLDSYKTNLFQSGKNATKYFAALIIAQDRSLFHAIKFKGKSAELSLADVLQSQFFEFCLKLGELSILANRLKSSSENLQQALQDKANQPGEYYFAYIQLLESVFDLVDFAFALKYILDPEAIYTAKYYTSYKPIAQNTIRSLKAAIEKNYGLILVYALQTIEPLIEQRVLQYETELEVLKAKLERNEISASSFQTSEKKHKKNLKTLRSTAQNIAFYGGFMVDVLSAKTTQETHSIIHKYAAPPGSYRVKRDAHFSFSLSAYPGVYLGLEAFSAEKDNSSSFVTGVTAPIGLSFNWGNFGLRRNSSSFSIFLPVIDIGAAFSYRWNSNSGEGFPQELKWEQVLSPGIHAVWGVPKAPIALMLGTQFTPLLRTISENGIELQSNALRFGATLAVDIPIFHFYKN